MYEYIIVNPDHSFIFWQNSLNVLLVYCLRASGLHAWCVRFWNFLLPMKSFDEDFFFGLNAHWYNNDFAFAH